jgi:hypothetical protein
MTIESQMALLAAASYADIRRLPENQAPTPAEWTEITKYALSSSGTSSSLSGSGFSARVFQKASGEVAISLAGTEFDATSGALADFTSGNVPLAFGFPGMQIALAADLYQTSQSRRLLKRQHCLYRPQLGWWVGQRLGCMV